MTEDERHSVTPSHPTVCEPCFYCGALNPPYCFGQYREHVIPKSWPGGWKHPRNLVLACGDCNREKGVNSPATWFFVLLRRGAEVGGPSVADRRVTLIWAGWADEIRLMAGIVNELSDPPAEGLWSTRSPMYGRTEVAS